MQNLQHRSDFSKELHLTKDREKLNENSIIAIQKSIYYINIAHNNLTINKKKKKKS